MKTVLIKGYYGYDNLGDDFLLYSILDTLNKAGRYNVIVVSAGDTYSSLFNRYKNLYCKTFPLSKWNKFSKLFCIAKCDYWIIGGGGLFPSEDRAGIPNWKREISIARSLKKKVCIYGVDINSINKEENKKAWYDISNLVSFIVCRNNKTKKMLDDIGCKNVIKTGDITFGLETEEELHEISTTHVKEKLGIVNEHFALWAIPMLWSIDDLDNESVQFRYSNLIKLLQSLANSQELKEYTHLFLPFFYKKDMRLFEDLIKNLDCKYIIVDKSYGLTYGEKRLLFKEANICLCMRFHAAMFSLFHKRPALYISYADKTSDVIREHGLEFALCEYGFSKNENFYKEFDLDYEDVIEKMRYILSGGGYEKVCLASDNLKKSTKIAKEKLIEWLK